MKAITPCLAGVMLALGAGLLLLPAVSPAAINVVAATPELADIAGRVGGSKVAAVSIARPNEDYHRVEARPSDVARVARAQVVVRIGMDLDLWFDALLNAAGNRAVNRGGPGYVDASIGIRKLDVPHEQITGASGDAHVYGNPHYFYDPLNAKVIAKNILAALSRVSPRDASAFEAGYRTFCGEIDSRLAGWQEKLAPFRGQPVVTYHESAVYFLQRFGLRSFGTLEPKPGIPPSAAHVSQLIQDMKQERVKAVVVDSIYPHRFPDLVARETGVKYQITPYSVGSLGTKSYFDLIDLMVSRYRQALG